MNERFNAHKMLWSFNMLSFKSIWPRKSVKAIETNSLDLCAQQWKAKLLNLFRWYKILCKIIIKLYSTLKLHSSYYIVNTSFVIYIISSATGNKYCLCINIINNILWNISDFKIFLTVTKHVFCLSKLGWFWTNWPGHESIWSHAFYTHYDHTVSWQIIMV